MLCDSLAEVFVYGQCLPINSKTKDHNCSAHCSTLIKCLCDASQVSALLQLPMIKLRVHEDLQMQR